MTRENFNLIQTIVKFESNSLNQDEIIKLFQNLLDTGYILNLEKSYHETARDLINQGLIQVR